MPWSDRESWWLCPLLKFDETLLLLWNSKKIAQIRYFYLIAHSSKEADEIFRISYFAKISPVKSDLKILSVVSQIAWGLQVKNLLVFQSIIRKGVIRQLNSKNTLSVARNFCTMACWSVINAHVLIAFILCDFIASGTQKTIRNWSKLLTRAALVLGRKVYIRYAIFDYLRGC